MPSYALKCPLFVEASNRTEGTW